MSQRKYEIDRSALLKILLHSLKFPTTGVAGILLGEATTVTAAVLPSASPPSSPRGAAPRQQLLRIYDAVPVMHGFLTTTMPLEAALVQLEEHCKRHGGGMRVVGCYQCNERLEDVEMDGCSRKIADRVETAFPGSVALVLDGRAATALASSASSSSVAPLRLLHKEGARGWIKAPTTGPEASFTCPVGGVADVLAEYVAEGRHRRLVDFEDHLEDIALDWLNPDLVA